MRVLTVRYERSKYYGDHMIYDNREECIEKLGIIPKKWFMEGIETGDWIECDDSLVMQCLNKYPLINRNKQLTYCYKFPNGMVSVYYNRGTVALKIGQLYASIVKANKSQIGDYSKVTGYQMMIMAGMIANGMPFGQAFRTATLGKRQLTEFRIRKILSNKIFREVIVNKFKNLEVKMTERFSAERLVNMLEDLYDDARPGSIARLQIIQQILSMTEFAKEEVSKRGQKEIQEAELVNENPPLLGV